MDNTIREGDDFMQFVTVACSGSILQTPSYS